MVPTFPLAKRACSLKESWCSAFTMLEGGRILQSCCMWQELCEKIPSDSVLYNHPCDTEWSSFTLGPYGMCFISHGGHVQVDNDGTVVSHGQEDGSSSDSGSSDGEDNDTAMGDAQQAEKQHAGPIIDEDGFQLVQRSRGKGKRGQGG